MSGPVAPGLAVPGLELVCEMALELGPPHELGAGPEGARRIIPVLGGTVTGPLIVGRVLPIGADWQTSLSGGLASLDARHPIETDDGAVIDMTSQGLRHVTPDVAARMASGEGAPPNEYYMRTAVRLSSGHPAYDWVNRSLFIASGGKIGPVVRLAVYRVT